MVFTGFLPKECYPPSLFAFSAALTVLDKSIATVIGPTPPMITKYIPLIPINAKESPLIGPVR